MNILIISNSSFSLDIFPFFLLMCWSSMTFKILLIFFSKINISFSWLIVLIYHRNLFYNFFVGCCTLFIMILTLNFFLSRGIYQLQVKGDKNDPKTQVRRIQLTFNFLRFSVQKLPNPNCKWRALPILPGNGGCSTHTCKGIKCTLLTCLSTRHAYGAQACMRTTFPHSQK